MTDAASRGAANRVHFKNHITGKRYGMLQMQCVKEDATQQIKHNAFTLGYLERSPSCLDAHTTLPRYVSCGVSTDSKPPRGRSRIWNLANA